MRRGGRRSAENRLGAVARQRMMEGNQLFRSGDYAAAAERFERMAPVARDRGMPRVAAHLSVRAAASHAKLGAQAAFDTWLDHAIADAKQDGDKERSSRMFGKLLKVVRDSPLAGQADALEQKVRSQVGVPPKVPEGEVVVNRSMRRHLPSKCAACGAPVEADEVEFNEDGSVDCDHCGSILQG